MVDLPNLVTDLQASSFRGHSRLQIGDGYRRLLGHPTCGTDAG